MFSNSTKKLLLPFFWLLKPVPKVALRFAIAVIAFSFTIIGNAQSVETDKGDYQPGDTLKITGSDWQAGEVVQIHIVETPTICPNGHYFYATADELGNIFNAQFVFKESHRNVAFLLTAVGINSGFESQTTFTDAGPSGAISISSTSAVTENFNSISLSNSAGAVSIPTAWSLQQSASPVWSSGSNAATQGYYSGSPATGGHYGWGNSTNTDKSVGAMTSGSFASPNSLMAKYVNDNPSAITQLTISYNAKKYRTNTSAASVQFFYSTDGSNWIAVVGGDIAPGTIGTGVNTYLFTNPAVYSVSSFNIVGLNIPNAGNIFLRWNINTTGSNSQGLGIDDVSVTATFAPAITPINYIYHEATTNNPGCGPDNFRSIHTPNSSQTMTAAWKIEYQFLSTNTALYYTTNGSTPAGSKGVGSGATTVIAGNYSCTFGSPIVDVAKATIPAQPAGTVVKYIIGAWNAVSGNELFANSGNCGGCGAITTSSGATVFSYTVNPTVTASAGPNGTISPSGSTTATYGGTLSYTIIANTGYYIADVLVDGVSVGAVSNYTFSNLTANHTISASFVPYINYVYHEATTSSIGCNGNNFRSIQTPDNTQPMTAAWKIEYQYGSTNTTLYYTTDGSSPVGAKGVPAGTTLALVGSYNCTFNVGGLVVDVAKGTIPAQPAGTVVKYIISAWNSNGGNEIFASSGTCNGCTPITTAGGATVFSYTVASTTVDYANLQFPPSATINTGGSITAYARVYKAGVTEAAGAGAGITTWIGYSTTNTNPGTWTNWVPATFNVQVGNDDEYAATFGSTLAPGTYYFATRVQLTGGPYSYGGYSSSGGGFWNGSSNVSGVLTVNCTTPATPTISTNGPTAFCSGNSVTLTSSYASGNTWSTGATSNAITVSASGSYTVTYTDGFGCSSASSGAVNVAVTQTPATPTISANSPTTFCEGGSVTLTSSNPTGNIWSNGATTQSIIATAAGNYSVSTTVSGCSSGTSTATPVVVKTFSGEVTILNETVGNPTTNTLINSYSGWSSTSPITFTSTDGVTDVRTTAPSGNYAGASGNGNVFMGIATTNNRNFIISGINTTGLASPVLSFGLHRDNTTNGLTVEVSSDGTNYTALSITQPPTANTWASTIATGTIPSTNNLRIRFSKNNGTSFRIDDIKVTGSNTAAAISQFAGCGVLTLTASPGSSYLWPTGATTQSISVNSTGTYSVTITSSNGCTSSASVDVSSIPAPVVVTIANKTDVTCFGNSTGSITFSATGGTSPYSGLTVSNLAAGNYSAGTYKVTDANGCTGDAPAFSISQPATALVASKSETAPLCNGGIGAVNVSATGGTPPYSGTGSFNVNAGAPYSFTVTDANGCTSTVSGTMSNPTPVQASSSFTAITCFGGTSTVTVSATGGTGSYSGTGSFTTNAGNYSYTVTDGNGCTDITTGIISQPAQLTISETVTNVTCNGASDGAISLTIGGGTPAEGALSASITQDFNALASTGTSSVVPSLSGSYQWAFLETGTSNSNNGLYTADNGNNTAGDTYSYGATGSTERALGGLRSGALIPFIGVKITNNTAKTVTAIDVSYYGEQWRLGSNGRNDRMVFQYSLNASSLSTGTWTDYSALDFVAPNGSGTVGALNGNLAANRSLVSGAITGLNLAPGASIWFGWKDFDATSSDDGLAVDDFTYTLKGLSNYTYSWSKDNTVIATTQNLENLTAGDYTVTVKDGNNCPVTKTITVFQPDPVTSTETQVACETFTWPRNGQTYNTSGTYSVTVSDPGVCPITYILNLTINHCAVDCVVSDWSEWSAWSTEACGQTATRTRTRTVITPAAYGGQECGPLTDIDTRQNPPCPVDCVVSDWSAWSAWSTEACGQTATRTRTRTVITPAAYGGQECGPLTDIDTRQNPPCPVNCVVSDWSEWSAWSTEACGQTATRTRTRTVITPAAYGGQECGPLTETDTHQNPPCPVNCVVSDWSEWSAWSTEACGQTATRTRTRTVITPAAYGGQECGPLTDIDTRQNPPCPVDCVVSDWSEWSAWSTEACGQTATRTRTRTVITPAAYGGQECGPLTDIDTRQNPPCPVDCVVSDWSAWSAWSTEACGQTATRTRTRTVITPAAYGGQECGPLTDIDTRQNPPCPVDCVVSDWSEWSAWSTEACGQTATRTRTRTVITPAAYGGIACGPLVETQSRVNPVYTINASQVITLPKCFGESGTVFISAVGGSGVYGATVGSFAVPASGSYSFVVTDNGGCKSNTIAGVMGAAPPAITSSISAQTNVLCYGVATGSATINASGGTGALSYNWSPAGGTAATATNLVAGNYSVTIKDANNCSKIQTVEIIQPASPLSVSCGNSNPQIYFGYSGDQTSTIKGTPTGGKAPYTVEITMNRKLICNYINSSGNEVWAPASGGVSSFITCTTNSANPVSTKTQVPAGSNYSVNVTLLDTAIFTITVTDANGCKATCTTTVYGEDVRCFAGNSGIAKVTICHKTGNTKTPCVQICVAQSAVQEHLDHGDFIGTCTKDCMAPPVVAATSAVSNPGTSLLQLSATELTVRVMNNPSVSNVPFRLQVQSDNQVDAIQMRVMDGTGKPVEFKTGVRHGQTVEIGRTYIQGMYFVEVLQGSQRKVVKLVKQ